MTTFITVAIPYVNAAPHVGYAFELVDADLAARARRRLGEDVRFLGGTDDYSLKNVLAAERVGESTRAFVDRHAERFTTLADTLGISFDDFIRTSRDPRHRPAVERLWRACAASGDLYLRDYEGHYCLGCEQYYEPDELDGGRCREHRTPAEVVAETNWFFRLSRFRGPLLDLIESGALRIEPEPFRNEILAFVRGGLVDISVSRSVSRARGWGIGVPDDPSQVVSVWFDALTNYISALGYGTGDTAFDRWWRGADERIHVVGKGITRFHTVYWPAFLLAAGQPPPTRVHVHPYLTVDGRKLSKSDGGNVAPDELVERYGVDALRWWFTAEVGATADTDLTEDRVVARSNADLAGGIGNAVRRITTLAGRVCSTPDPAALPLEGAEGLADDVADALADFDRRRATSLIERVVRRLNRNIEERAPWRLTRDPGRRHELDDVLACHLATLDRIVTAFELVAPDLAERARIELSGTTTGRRPPIQPRLVTRSSDVGAGASAP
jgi:methionyl-tRNA synthetase